MNNPMPRGNSFFARLVAAQSNRVKAEEAIEDSTADAATVAKANALVTQILDSGDAFIAEDELAQESLETPAKSNDTTKSGYSTFRLPSYDNCGLVNPNIELDDSQLEAVHALKDKQYGCLIGAAGTGKTTVQKYLIREILYGNDTDFQVKGIPGTSKCNIAFVAFTGMAVQVMRSNLPEWLHGCCQTIHGLLEFMPEEQDRPNGEKVRMFVPTRHNLNKLNEDLIIIDEASMVGMDLWIQLITACKRGTRIIMTGDLNQLPPIIGQPIFAYALSNWHVSELTTVHRQKGVGANRIIDIAHQVLNGEMPTFDESKGRDDWRVIYGQLDKNPEQASKQILRTLMALRDKQMPDGNGNMIAVYDPHKDRVMTAGNGYDMNKTSDFVQQAPLNEHLARLIEPPTTEHPRLIIDAGRSWKKFSIHNRVMATKNEAPNRENRVTNGQAGTIIGIEANPRYKGDRGKVGTEESVAAYRKMLIESAHQEFSLEGVSQMELDDEDLENFGIDETESEAEGGGAASHIITVKYDNGALREASSKAQVDAIQLAYCSTVAKCQGSQFDTAIIICHPAQKAQLSREWLYTAITRAAKRVIVLGTEYGLRYAISRQKISGKTIADKVARYHLMMNEGVKNFAGVTVRVNVPVTIEDYFDRHYLYEKAK